MGIVFTASGQGASPKGWYALWAMSSLRRKLRSRWQLFAQHPLTRDQKLRACWRYLRFHSRHRLRRGPAVYPFVGKTLFAAEPGMAGIVSNIYTGLQDFEEMAFLLHLLREDDLFVDVGANVGAYTLLAAGVCASSTIALEPVPATFADLQSNLALNNLGERVQALNAGAGATAGRLSFTQNAGTMNRVADDGVLSSHLVEVEVTPLDQLLGDRAPLLIKIDVEGFEYDVLQGASSILPKTQALLVELNGSAAAYGHSDDEVHRLLLRHGFHPYNYDPWQRKLEKLDSFNVGRFNTTYLRNPSFVERRLTSAAPFRVLGKSV